MNPPHSERLFRIERSAHEQRIRWPNGAGLAVSFVLNIEEGAELSILDGDKSNEGVHEVTHRIEGVPDFCMATHFEYGSRAGYARILRRFTQLGMPLTLNACGRALERTPWVAEDAHRHGLEICAHGWRWESPATMSVDEERSVIHRTCDTIERLWGRAPVGWHNKSSRSVHTRSLLAERGGFLYDSDDYGDDIPFTLRRPDGRAHVVLPYGFDTNDMRFYDRGGFVRAGDFSGYVIDAIEALRVEARDAPRMLTIGLHTRIIGRPGRIAGLDAVIAHLRTLDARVWVDTREGLARHWLSAIEAQDSPD